MTLAGDGAPGFTDGQPSGARFADIFGIALDREGNVYVADAGDNNRIRKITPQGVVSSLAGGAEGFTDGQGTFAAFNTPSALAADASGNLYVADTGNHSIRKITPEGMVTTLAGDGRAGYLDGPGRAAEFNAPVGVAVDAEGDVYVADTYNDRIRKVDRSGEVTTLAGGSAPGYQDGPAATALFDTPCALAVTPAHELFIADTGNGRLRKLSSDGQVTTLALSAAPESVGPENIVSPVGLALTYDGFLYVTDNYGGRILQVTPGGTVHPLAGGGRGGFADGDGASARFNNPAGIALDRRGDLYIADTSNHLVRKLTGPGASQSAALVEVSGPLPKLTAETLRLNTLPWPVEPQHELHEVVATMGEVRGSYRGESRDHLHSGIDVQGNYGTIVRAIYDEKVSSPLCNWDVNGLNEGLRIGVMAYIHIRVGRNQQDGALDPVRFKITRDEKGKPTRVRISRGTRFHVGDALGSINRMNHVHLNVGPSGAEINPLSLPFAGFGDHVAPTIEHDGIQLFDSAGQRLKETLRGRLLVKGDTSIVVEAYDQVDHNLARRRLGLYRLGYQVLRPDGTPAGGYEAPRINIEFNRLPSDPLAVKMAYADTSGITVYGSATTRFLYQVTNTIRDGQIKAGTMRASELPAGDYVLRIIAADYSGNEASAGRDLPFTIQ